MLAPPAPVCPASKRAAAEHAKLVRARLDARLAPEPALAPPAQPRPAAPPAMPGSLGELEPAGKRRGVSHKEARAYGWERVDARPWGKCHARWLHRDGWLLEHCGHPTALYPWALYAPDGAMHLTGALQGQPENGVAWPTLRDPMRYVARLLAWQSEQASAATFGAEADPVAAAPTETTTATPRAEVTVPSVSVEAPTSAPASPEHSEETVFAAHVATHAYRQGFAHGADPRRAQRAHVCDPSTDAHWRRGFHAGRAAAGAAERAFFTGMLRSSASGDGAGPASAR